MNDFIKVDNFYKIEILKEQDKEFKDIINGVLDSKLRNGIGHYKTHFEIKNQKIIYYPFRDDIIKAKNKAKKKEIYYIDFVRKTLDLLVVVFSVNYLITSLFAIYYSIKNRRSFGLKNIELDFSRHMGKKEPEIKYIYFWNETDYSNSDVFDYDFSYWDLNYIYDYYSFIGAEKVQIDKNSLIFEDTPSDTKIIVNLNTKTGKKWYKLYLKNKEYSSDFGVFKPIKIPFF